MHHELKQSSGPEAGVATPLLDVWLRFHEKEFCQDLDTVFVFHPQGMEIWCRVEDERSYQRFSEMLEPLRSSFEIAVYVTRPSPQKKSREDDDPPPSLWNNETLQYYLSETSRNIPLPGEEDQPFHASRRAAMKQRLLLWADQILSWDNKVRRFAADLPALARLAFGGGGDPAIKKRAASVCLAHCQSLDRNLSRLSDNLGEALPRASKASRAENRPAKLYLPTSPAELVAIASSQARKVAERVYHFIYPQGYTVELSDLKQSSLLEALREVRRILAELQKIAAPPR